MIEGTANRRRTHILNMQSKDIGEMIIEATANMRTHVLNVQSEQW